MHTFTKCISLLIVAGLMTGCSIPRSKWVHDFKEPKIWYQDKLNCEEYAGKLAIDMYPLVQPAPAVVVNTVVDGEQKNKESQKTHHDPNQYKREQYKDSLVKDCLYAEGWQKIKIVEQPTQ